MLHYTTLPVLLIVAPLILNYLKGLTALNITFYKSSVVILRTARLNNTSVYGSKNQYRALGFVNICLLICGSYMFRHLRAILRERLCPCELCEN
jgi:hypothetical protein